MTAVLDDLVHLLTLERLEVNLFRGESRDIGSKQVYGGQVLGQALAAAYYTVDDDRFMHSLHAYFLRRGDMHAPIVYEVDRQRDGRSFSNRRVVAVQHGRPIFNLACSFQVREPGLDHADEMPDVPPPEVTPDLASLKLPEIEKLPAQMRRFLVTARAFEFRPVGTPQHADPGPREPIKYYWFKTVDRLPDDRRLHEAMLAYVSDYGLMPTSPLPHGHSLQDPRLQMASLDHALWLHRPFRVDEWLLYVCESTSAAGSKGFARGRIFTADGKLVAITSQEGLIRLRDD